MGRLTYFRVYCGSITSNSQVWNVTRDEHERIGQLFVLRGKNQEAVQEIAAGDIGAVAKLTVTATNDTLGTKEKHIKLVPIVFPEPRYSEAVYPKTKLDLDKLGPSLAKIVEEDPTLKMHREATTNETILSGIGEIQLSVTAEKMARKFGVNVELQTPKVPYKETITMSARLNINIKSRPADTANTDMWCWNWYLYRAVREQSSWKELSADNSEELYSGGGKRRP